MGAGIRPSWAEARHATVVRTAIAAACLPAGVAVENAADLAYKAALNDGWYAADWTVGHGPSREAEAAVLRDIFGNPFAPPALDPSWRTPAVLAVAKAIYAERRFEDMPILADLLEELGCRDDELLSHCRRPGSHWRGCFVIDLLLQKE